MDWLRRRTGCSPVAMSGGKVARLRSAVRPLGYRQIEHAGQALAQGIAPGTPEARLVLDRIVPPDTPAARRAALLEQLKTFTDARIERYWQLLAIINGQPVPPPAVPSFDWLIAALRADLRCGC